MSSIYASHSVAREDRANGSIILTSKYPLEDVAHRTTDWLDRWSAETPNAILVAERSGAGWREVSYREAQDIAHGIAASLLDRNVSQERPILIISGNSVDHALLTLAAQYIGVPTVPVAEQYALIPAANGQLDYVAGLTNPGIIYAQDGDVLSEVLKRPSFANAEIIVSQGGNGAYTTIAELAKGQGDISAATAKVGPDTIAKILMTSGSTSSPKGVQTTHRMMCTNQTQLAQSLPFVREKPPVIVDWLPWNHVFGGSHNFNLMLANGGAHYIDPGKPAPGLFEKSVETLRLKTGSIAFNVPVGFAKLRDVMKEDKALRDTYFRDMDMLFYAGASLPQDVWTDLEDMAREVRGDVPLFTSSWGLTETAPASLLQFQKTDLSGIVGVPMPGLSIKLLPNDENRYEVRVKGPTIFQGYLNDPEKTADAFDEEGYFCTGDAMKFVDPADVNLGLKFDGRISEDFKLLTGTWVRAAQLRLDVLAPLGPLAQDIVITGADRNQIGVFIIPSPAVRDRADVSENEGALISPSAAQEIKEALAKASGSGSSTRLSRALILSELPSIADGEITAKGNLNFHKIQTRRADLLERLYDDQDAATILV